MLIVFLALIYESNAKNTAASNMYQKNLRKHPMHPVMPLPRKDAANTNACTPQPAKPRMIKAIISTPMIPSIAIMSSF